MADLSVWYQPLAGGWVKLGTQASGGRGVHPESIQLEGDRGEGGCLAASFKLKQDPRWINVEMQPFTPIAVWDGAEPIWSGRTIMAPTTFGEDDIEVVVQCQGWWQHLKDDCTDREWVIADATRFVPSRGLLTTNLTRFTHSTSETVGEGGILFTIPNAAPFVAATILSSATIDLGENNACAYVIFDREIEGSLGASYTFYCRVSNNPDPFEGGTTDVIFDASPATSPDMGGAATPGRYVHFFLYRNGGSGTRTSDATVRVKNIILFTDATDHVGDASDLRASTVISETLDAVAPLISPRRDRITTTTLALPNFPGAPGWRYGHELIQQANAPHGYIARLTPDPVPVFEYHPVPTDYRFVLGEGDYTLVEPAAQDGQLVHSRVVSEYEDAAGVRSFVDTGSGPHTRATTQLPDNDYSAGTNGGWTNPPATVGVTPSNGGGYVSLKTQPGFHDASHLYDSPQIQLAPLTEYVIQIRIWTSASCAGSGITWIRCRDGSGATLDPGFRALTPDASWYDVEYTVVTTADGLLDFRLAMRSSSSGTQAEVRIDDVWVMKRRNSVVARRGFTRTALRPMTHRTTAATAGAVADLELDAAQFPPFKGTIAVTGRIPLKGGGHMDVSHLPAMVGENVALSNLIAPNSQRMGRIGNIQSVTYNHDKRVALIGIDRDLKFISQLRSRLETASR